MRPARRLARHGAKGEGRRRVLLISAGLALAAVALALIWLGLGLGRDFVAVPGGGPPQATAVAVKATAEAPIILAGTGSQTTDLFYLVGGTYRGDWSAWGEAPEFPPCTHSAELMAVDASNGKTSRGDVTLLAKSVDVPATGASHASYVYDVRPGDYYVAVTSACAWQIALSPD